MNTLDGQHWFQIGCWLFTAAALGFTFGIRLATRDLRRKIERGQAGPWWGWPIAKEWKPSSPGSAPANQLTAADVGRNFYTLAGSKLTLLEIQHQLILHISPPHEVRALAFFGRAGQFAYRQRLLYQLDGAPWQANRAHPEALDFVASARLAERLEVQ